MIKLEENGGDKIIYSEMEEIYRKASEGSIFPKFVFSTESSLRRLFGDEAVDRGLAEGTITYFNIDEIIAEGCDATT